MFGTTGVHPPVKKYIISIAIFIIVDIFIVSIFIIFRYQNIAWFLNNIFSTKKLTYPTSLINNTPIGNLDIQGITKKLDMLSAEEKEKKFDLSYNADHWQIKLSDLGLKLDSQMIAETLFLPNEHGLKTLWKQKNRTINIEPTFEIDRPKCIETLNQTILIGQPPLDASLEVRANDIITTKETDGLLLNATDTCQTIQTMLNNKTYSSPIKIIILPAKIKSDNYTVLIERLKKIILSPVTITYLDKKWELSAEKILALIDLESGKKIPDIIWDEKALEDLTDKIAQEIGAIDPHNKICEKNPSGKILDGEGLKSFIKELENNNERSYAIKTLNDNKSPKSDLKLGKGTIYLTFDDGLTYGNTIMDYASCYNVKITFFEVASRAKSESKQLIRAVQEGHAVESHGFLHAVFDYGTGHSYAWQYNDILSSVNILKNITGKRPKFFRPPGGNKTKDTYAAASAAGVKLILWNISSIDTKPIPASEICHNILSQAKNNGVVLMHSTHSETAKAVPCIIEGLKYKGYTLKALE